MVECFRPGAAAKSERTGDEQQLRLAALSIIHTLARLPSDECVDRQSNWQKNAPNVSCNFVHVGDLSMASETVHRMSSWTLSESLARRSGLWIAFRQRSEASEHTRFCTVGAQDLGGITAVMSRVLQRPCDAVGKVPG